MGNTDFGSECIESLIYLSQVFSSVHLSDKKLVTKNKIAEYLVYCSGRGTTGAESVLPEGHMG